MYDSYATISLTKGFVTKVSLCDLELVLRYPWYTHMNHNNPNHKPVYYACCKRPKETIRMHNLIMGRLHIDHRNGDGLDNQRNNLRVGSRGQNRMNSHSIKSKSGFIGVYKEAHAATWAARHNSKHIGNFKTAEDAARAYDSVVFVKYGEFAQLNFPHASEREFFEKQELDESNG